jgi:hypothetical protein
MVSALVLLGAVSSTLAARVSVGWQTGAFGYVRDGQSRALRPAKLQRFLPRSMPSINNLPGGHRGEVSYVVPRSEDIDLKKCSACW